MKRIIPLVILSLLFAACHKEEPQTEAPVDTDTTELNLLSHIGNTSPFNGSESICSITPYVGGDFDSNAIPIGQKVNDFTLYNKDGNAFNLENILLEGKPLFIMTGSYTCPAYRAALTDLNQLISDYGNDVTFLIAYTVEAHPIIDYSPYFDTVNTTQINVNQGILYEQPTTYEERKTIVSDMLNNSTINCEVILDSPCNEFWTAYGEAPNRAYLIDTAGVVQISQGWFNYPYAVNAIDTYLGQ